MRVFRGSGPPQVYGPYALKVIAVNEEWQVGAVNELIVTRYSLKQVEQPLLQSRMQVKSRLVEQQDRTLIGLPGLSKENEAKRKEPLESVAAFLKRDGKLVVLVGNLEHDVFPVCIEVQLMALFGPPLDPVTCQCE